MLQLDPDDVDEEETNKVLTALSSGTTNSSVNSTVGSTILTEADKQVLNNYKVNNLLQMLPYCS